MTDRRILVLRTVLVWVLLELLAAAQVRAPDGGPLLFSWARSAVSPVLWAGEAISSLAGAVVKGVTGSADLVLANRELRVRLEASEALRELMAEDLAAVLESDRMAASVPRLTATARPARAIYRNLAQGRMIALVDDRQRIDPDTPAMAVGGVVGRVVRADGLRCWIELLTHPVAAVAVQTRDGRIQGLAVGSEAHGLDVQFVPRQVELLRGTELITSGADGIYPPGLPVCRVTSVRESAGAFLEVRAAPTAELETARVILLLEGWQVAAAQRDVPR